MEIVDKINPIRNIGKLTKKIGNEVPIQKVEEKKPETSFEMYMVAARARLEARKGKIDVINNQLAKYDNTMPETEELRRLRRELSDLIRGNLIDKAFLEQKPEVGQQINILG